MVSVHQNIFTFFFFNIFTLYKVFFLLLYYCDGLPAASVASFFIIFEE